MGKEYLKIYDYWNKNRCRSFNAEFPFMDYAGKRVLEIGYGDGIDGEAFVNAGANYVGIDLHNPLLPYRLCFRQMNAEELEFPDNYFDLVYSWGVIHHAVSPEKIVEEIYRVLKPDGQFYVMLYNKPSFRYNIEIMFLRKILWHCRNMKYDAIREEIPNPTKAQWISMNTDTIGCPLSRVYDQFSALKMFDEFRDLKTFTRRLEWFRIITGIK